MPYRSESDRQVYADGETSKYVVITFSNVFQVIL